MKLIILSFIAVFILSVMPEKDSHNNMEAGQKPFFSFGLIADAQYADSDPAGNRYYRESISKLKEALSELKKDSADFVINLGDIIDSDFNSYKDVLGIIANSGIKTYHITGNHDYTIESSFKKNIPLNLPSGKGYYSFVHRKFRFIMLNGNEISVFATDNKKRIKEAADYIQNLKNKGKNNAIDWNGGISRKQLEWLDSEIEKSETAGEKVLIFCHYPVWPENYHNLLNYNEVLTLLGKHKNIIAWFNGHNHAGNYGNFNMIHFITMKGMVETENTNSFALVEVYKNKLWIRGSGREKSQILAY